MNQCADEPNAPEAYIEFIATNLADVIALTQPTRDEIREMLIAELRRFWTVARDTPQPNWLQRIAFRAGLGIWRVIVALMPKGGER